MTLQTIALDKIIAGDGIDSRTTGRDEGLGSLAASIKAHGLLQPIVVRNMPDGRVQVVAGNRRLAALQLLAGAGDIDAAFAVETVLRDRNDADAHEISVAENFQRLPPHPVDQHEAFARIGTEQQLDAAAIAARFGTTERHVEKMLALGGLHPDIRTAWRAGELRDDDVQAFTLARGDVDRQKKVFAKLKKAGHCYAHLIRSELGGSDHSIGPALAAVGIDAYRAAGGTATEDLFGSQPVVSDAALLQRLVKEKVTTRCDELIADGWSFAIDRSTVENPWQWRRTQAKKIKPSDEIAAEIASIEARQKEFEEREKGLTEEEEDEAERLEARRDAIDAELERQTFTPRQKKKLGCFVDIGRDGGLAVEYGIERPEQTKAKEKDKSKKEREKAAKENGSDPDAPALSNSLVHDLSIQMSTAVSRTIAGCQPVLALAAVYAALHSPTYESPIKVQLNGIPALHKANADLDGDAEEDDATFDEQDEGNYFARLFNEGRAMMKSPPGVGNDLVYAVAAAVAQAVELRKHSPRKWNAGERALLDALDLEDFAGHAREVFRPDDYFKRAPLAMAKAALEEMGRPVPKGGKKADMMAAAIAAQADTGWVPADLRLPPRPAAPALAQAAE